MAIRFFSDGISFQPEGKREISHWLKQIAHAEGKKIGSLCYIFVSDETILDINKKFLHHDYYTDIITFDYSEGSIISGDVFISLDTVKTNAEKFNVDYVNELYRVIIHGILHLCGIDDKAEGARKIMEENEDNALSIIHQIFEG